MTDYFLARPKQLQWAERSSPRFDPENSRASGQPVKVFEAVAGPWVYTVIELANGEAVTFFQADRNEAEGFVYSVVYGKLESRAAAIAACQNNFEEWWREITDSLRFTHSTHESGPLRLDDGKFVGAFRSERALVLFEGQTIEAAKADFHEAMDDYLADCTARGVQP